MRVNFQYRKYWRKTKQIQVLVKKYQDLSDEAIQNKTIEFRSRLKEGNKLKSLLAEAYAVVCVASERVLNLKPFPVQIFGAIAMFDRNVIEMKTGEGKTLTATMLMYLHGLTGNGNFLVTANSYLAKRDALNVGRVYRWLGLTVSYNHQVENGKDKFAEIKLKQTIYEADIVYTDSSSLGFDYLFDNLSTSKDKQYMPTLNFALIDEADAVLLDMAATPLVISGTPKAKSNYTQIADTYIKTLKLDRDYALSEDLKKVWFLPEGISRANEFYGVKNILDRQNADLFRHLILALRANYVLKRNQDYLVENNKIMLIDENNGRKLPGMQLQAGQHQAIEAKEGLEISYEQRAIATITYQNFYRMFSDLAGMTGTASNDQHELQQIYNLSVVKVPTNRKSIRQDLPDQLYYTEKSKINQSLKLVKQNFLQGRPVLIETGSLGLSEHYSKVLLHEHIPHNLLNANSTAKEAQMIKVAGQVGMVTVSTSMAGRGTDIILSKEAQELGGLFVLGTERMSIKRIDEQLRGRAGRQGEPGTTVFFTSLQDKIIMKFPSKRIAKEIKNHSNEQKAMQSHFTHLINHLQKNNMYQQQAARFMTLQYGEVMRLQREAVYQLRNRILNEEIDLNKLCKNVIKKVINRFFLKKDLKTSEITDFIVKNFDSNFLGILDGEMSHAGLKNHAYLIARRSLRYQKQKMKNKDAWNYYLQLAVLKAIDDSWVNQVDNLEQLRMASEQRVLGQQDSLFDYQQEALRSFNEMKNDVSLRIVRYILCSTVSGDSNNGMQIRFA